MEKKKNVMIVDAINVKVYADDKRVCDDNR